MNSLSKFISKQLKDIQCLMRSIPSGLTVIYLMSVVLMNLFASKELKTGFDWLVLDCGFLLSWISFLCMDIVTKHFGPKAAVKLSFIAIFVNLCACLIFKFVALLPGNWSEFYTFENECINEALNNTFGGNWFVLFGSTVAFITSSIVNAFVNFNIGKIFKKSNYRTFALRSYVSTLVAQLVDNLTFAFIVSLNFFGWSLTQCIVCSFCGCIAELLCEVIFGPIGFKVCKKWQREQIGKEYLSMKGD